MKENIKESVFPDDKTTTIDSIENFIYGSTYLAVYSDIYDLTEESTHLLTATISIRNTNDKDSIFITRADYFNTKGKMVRSYINNPVYLTPLETIEIIIPRRDTLGGSGAKFIFEWAIPDKKHEPLFESVMIWTTGNQGISFTSRGINFLD
jgi:hypothetical protein